MDFWYGLFTSILRVIQVVTVKELHVEGREHIPSGPKIIVGNHPNTTDSIVLPYIYREKLCYLIYMDTFHVPVWGPILARAGHVPIGPNIGRQALDGAKKRLAQGESVVILPEGRMTLEGEDRVAGTGAIWLSLETGIPLLPMGFYVPPESIRTARMRSRDGGSSEGRWPLRGQSFVQIGEVWNPGDYVSEKASARVKRELTEKLMARINELAQEAKEQSQT